MARYIDADALKECLGMDCSYRVLITPNDAVRCMARYIDEAPTADVVPKSEVDKTIAEWAWLHADTLNKLDKAKAEVARAIFAEIEDIAILNDYICVKDFYTNHPLIAELKKKYIPKDCRYCKHMLSCEPNVFGICEEYEEKET